MRKALARHKRIVQSIDAPTGVVKVRAGGRGVQSGTYVLRAAGRALLAAATAVDAELALCKAGNSVAGDRLLGETFWVRVGDSDKSLALTSTDCVDDVMLQRGHRGHRAMLGAGRAGGEALSTLPQLRAAQALAGRHHHGGSSGRHGSGCVRAEVLPGSALARWMRALVVGEARDSADRAGVVAADMPRMPDERELTFWVMFPAHDAGADGAPPGAHASGAWDASAVVAQSARPVSIGTQATALGACLAPAMQLVVVDGPAALGCRPVVPKGGGLVLHAFARSCEPCERFAMTPAQARHHMAIARGSGAARITAVSKHSRGKAPMRAEGVHACGSKDGRAGIFNAAASGGVEGYPVGIHMGTVFAKAWDMLYGTLGWLSMHLWSREDVRIASALVQRWLSMHQGQYTFRLPRPPTAAMTIMHAGLAPGSWLPYGLDCRHSLIFITVLACCCRATTFIRRLAITWLCGDVPTRV